MKILKKIFAVMTAAVMAAGALAVTAGAASIFDNSKLLKSGKSASTTLRVRGSVYYRIEPTKSGNFKISYSIPTEECQIYFYSSAGSLIKPSKVTADEGKATTHSDGMVIAQWDKSTAENSGTLTYELSKGGSYYIRFCNTGTDKAKLKVSGKYPTGTVATISHFTLQMKKGDVVQMGAVVSGSGKVYWSSSKKTVAIVSSTGKITAKGKGTATIIAKVGSTKLKIDVIVK